MSHQSYLNTRDLEKRLQELISAKAQFIRDPENGRNKTVRAEAWGETEEAEELAKLEELKDTLSHCWFSNTTLIPEDEFVEYAKDYAEDVVGANASDWPMNHIDWAAAAYELRQDFIAIEFRDETYLYR